VAVPPLPPPDLGDLVARTVRRLPWARRERPFRFLLDGRLFRLLCGPGQTAALDNFRASVTRLRLAPAGSLPDLELTPLAILDVLGIEPPRFPALALPKDLTSLDNVDLAFLLKEAITKDFEKVPELEASNLCRRAEELRAAVEPAAHELFDLCLTRFVTGDEIRGQILEQLTFEALLTFRFPEDCREKMTHLFNLFLLDYKTNVSGLSRVRLLKAFWERSFERILRKHSKARGEVLAVDQEMKPRTYKDFLGWEVIHHSVLGALRKRFHPVIAFAPEPEDRLRARCKAHKTALRVFLDEIPQEELAGVFRPHLMAWRPGWLVPCREDGMLEAPVSTADVVVF